MKTGIYKYIILAAAVIMEICLGATYSWSVFVAPLKSLTGLGQGPVQVPFTMFYIVFPATLIFTGSLLSKIGPRVCAMTGGAIFGGGWLLASFGKHHFLFTLLGIGFFGGLGAGFAYIVPIAVCIQWFPKYKGLVTGVAVAGFGGGAALVTEVSNYLMLDYGATPFDAFRLFGFIFLAAVTIAGATMKNAPGAAGRGSKLLPLKSVLSDKMFSVLYLAMFSGLMAGFTINANMKELYQGDNLRAGVTAVSLFAIANALGRIIWGFYCDKVKAQTAIKANLLFQSALLFTAPLFLKSSVGLMVMAFIAGFNYGGVLVIYASTTAGRWGAENVGQVYGWLFSANIPASLAPVIAGFIFDYTGSFILPLTGLGVILAAAAVFIHKTFHLTEK